MSLYKASVDRLAADVSFMTIVDACLLRDRLDGLLREGGLGHGGAELLAELQREDVRLIDLLTPCVPEDQVQSFLAARRSYNPPQSAWWWYKTEAVSQVTARAFSGEAILNLLTVGALLLSLVGGLVLALRLSQSEVSLTDLSTYLQVLIPILAAAGLTSVGRQLADTTLRIGRVKEKHIAHGRMVLALVLMLGVVVALLSLPIQATWYNTKGDRAFDGNDFPAALDAFQQAVSIDPNNAAAFYNLANTYDELSRPDEAIIAYRRALELSDPRPRTSVDNPPPTPSLTWFAATNNLAQLLTLYGEDTDAATAIALLTRALAFATPELEPTLHAALFRNRAFAHLTLGHFHNAQDDLAAATHLAPDAAATGCVTGLFYEHKDNPFRDEDAATSGWFSCLGASPADRIPSVWSAIAQERYRSTQ